MMLILYLTICDHHDSPAFGACSFYHFGTHLGGNDISGSNINGTCEGCLMDGWPLKEDLGRKKKTSYPGTF
jgi:hypothetical protein